MTTFSGLFGGSAGVGPYSVPHRGYKSGKYYSVAQSNDLSTSDQQTLVAGTIYYTPFYVHSDVTISGITFANGGTGDNGKNVRVGIYTNNLGSPDALVIAASPVTLTAAIAAREAAVSATLPKGWYWFALQLETGASIRNVASPGLDQGWSVIGIATPVNAVSSVVQAAAIASTYGALPSTALAPTATGFILFCGIKVA